MSAGQHRVLSYFEQLAAQHGIPEMEERLRPKSDDLPAHLAGSHLITPDAIDARWARLGARLGDPKSTLLDSAAQAEAGSYRHNIENFIGVVRIPLGFAGPLRVNGLFAQGDYFVPLATTEAALVASYHRGTQLLTEAGGCTAMLLSEGVTRAPGFAFRSVAEAGKFVAWAVTQREEFAAEAHATTSHGRLVDLRVTVEGSHVYLSFDFTTGDAAGQNMVTIATGAICAYIEKVSPVRPEYLFVEANMSGDKKASAQSFLGVRGKKVTAEAVIPADLLRRHLRTTAAHMENYWRMSAVGGILSGTIGVHGHYANGLTALYLACGQDAACVAESAVGVTRFEEREDGALYTCVTLPNIMVGTVGGGSGTPTAAACLDILGLRGTGGARAFAEVAAALILAGELSIIGALCSGDFARAHQRLARGKRGSRQATGGAA